MLKITLDTNVVDDSRVVQAARQLGCDVAAVSVSDRELSGTRFSVHLSPLGHVAEAGTYGEARYGHAGYASDRSSQRLEEILRILSDGSFPQSRANLSDGERRQLRDALILEAHIQEGRSVLVTNDKKAFINHGKRENLEAAFSVRILSGREFIDGVASGRV